MDSISQQWFGNCTRSIQAWITFEAAHFQKCIIQGFGKKIYHGSVYFHQTGGKIIAGMVFSRNLLSFTTRKCNGAGDMVHQIIVQYLPCLSIMPRS